MRQVCGPLQTHLLLSSFHNTSPPSLPHPLFKPSTSPFLPYIPTYSQLFIFLNPSLLIPLLPPLPPFHSFHPSLSFPQVDKESVLWKLVAYVLVPGDKTWLNIFIHEIQPTVGEGRRRRGEGRGGEERLEKEEERRRHGEEESTGGREETVKEKRERREQRCMKQERR